MNKKRTIQKQTGEHMSPIFLKKILFVVFAIFLAGCSLQPNQITTTPLEESFTSVDPGKLNLIIGGGRLNLSAGELDAITGEIQNNVPDRQPVINNEANAITIEQSSIYRISTRPNEKTINDWTLQLANTPLDLHVESRATINNFNLTGVPLHSLTLLDSVTATEISLDAQNPSKLEEFEIGSSGSNFVFRGISNANFEQMNMRAVGGSYILDFSGDLQQDANITLVAGLGKLQVEIPAEIPATITVSGTTSGLETNGGWIANQNVYTNPGEGHQLIIEIFMDMGTLVLALN